MGQIIVSLQKKSEIHLREATPLDSPDLNRFFSSIPILGFLIVKIHRQVDFFSLFHRLGQSYKTFILEKIIHTDSILPLHNSAPEILGTASFLFQNRICDKISKKIAYGCDLRISPQRKAILSWGKYFLPQVKKLIATESLDHIITSINLTETQVINAFIRPKITRIDRPIYELVQKYNLVTIHGFYPMQFSRNKNIFISKLAPTDKDSLLSYISQKLNNLELVANEYTEDLQQALQKSLLYSLNQFLVAKDLSGNIIGCVHPVASSLLQDYFPQSYTEQANNFRQFLKLSSFLGFTRKLTRPFSRTNKEQTLTFKMLHFLFFEHPDVMNSLIYTAYKQSQNNEFLIYAYQPENFFYRPPRGAIQTEIPYALYEIKTPEQSILPLKTQIQKFIFLDNLWF